MCNYLLHTTDHLQLLKDMFTFAYTARVVMCTGATRCSEILFLPQENTSWSLRDVKAKLYSEWASGLKCLGMSKFQSWKKAIQPLLSIRKLSDLIDSEISTHDCQTASRCSGNISWKHINHLHMECVCSCWVLRLTTLERELICQLKCEE